MLDLLEHIPDCARLVEVGPRDGLQNEPIIVPTPDKLRYIQLLAQAGFQDIEVTSFVNPARVPQLADAAEIIAGILASNTPGPGAPRYSALVPNRRGLDRAVEAGVGAIALFTAASETFTRQNIGMTIAGSLAEFRLLTRDAKARGIWVRAYISTAFVCPYEGRIAPARVRPIIEELLEMGVEEISIGDTIGHAVPTDVARLTEFLIPVLPLDKFAYHFHDTRGFALANVLMALQYGVWIFDSSAGGVGGCPFAPGAAGNVASEGLLALFDGMGIATGVDIEKVRAASTFLETVLGRPLAGRSHPSA